METPHLYLDTGILLDGILKRKQASLQLLEQAKLEVSRGNWLCSTSRWTIIEVLDNIQEERYVEKLRIDGHLLSRIRSLLGNRRQKEAGLKLLELDKVWLTVHDYIDNNCSFISCSHPRTVKMWDKAEDYCGATNIGSTDALHLASAVLIGCNVLVSNDQDFIAIANEYIFACHPHEVDTTISKLNSL
ncbi:type II toxin-antitoxin system VapC family toxin [Chloroflexota bacterium]